MLPGVFLATHMMRTHEWRAYSSGSDPDGGLVVSYFLFLRLASLKLTQAASLFVTGQRRALIAGTFRRMWPANIPQKLAKQI